MTPEELAERYLEFRNRLFSHSSIVQRGFAQIGVAPLVYFFSNFAHRWNTKLMKNGFHNYFNWLNQQKAATRYWFGEKEVFDSSIS
jgi:hypothetical protein